MTYTRKNKTFFELHQVVKSWESLVVCGMRGNSLDLILSNFFKQSRSCVKTDNSLSALWCCMLQFSCQSVTNQSCEYRLLNLGVSPLWSFWTKVSQNIHDSCDQDNHNDWKCTFLGWNIIYYSNNIVKTQKINYICWFF